MPRYWKAESFKERAAGIEPASSAWKAEVLPLNYARGSTRVRVTCPDAVTEVTQLSHYDLPTPSPKRPR